MRVIVTKHAHERYLQYTGHKVNKHILCLRLKSKLACGVSVINDRVIFPAGNGLRAVCAPSAVGWVVITFLR